MAEAQSAAAGPARTAAPPTNRRFLNPDDPVCVLLVGPSQNGKTTLVNRLISMAANRVEKGREGDKNKKCTLTTTEYDLEVPMSQYVLVGKTTGLDVTEIAPDEGALMTQWKKIRAKDYAIRMADADPLCLKLHLIDTPGLDDSEHKDYENMEDVLGTLNRLSQAEEPWKRKLNAMVLVYNSKNPFSGSFQTIVHNYHKCMPNLFETMAVVNTHFDMVELGQKRISFIRGGIISAAESALHAIMGSRAEDFKRLVDLPLAPMHFHVDNRPGEGNAYADIMSRNTIADLISYLAASLSSPMPIKQMRVVKSPDMEMVDTALQRLLKHATDRWSSELKDVRGRASDAEAFRSTVLQLRTLLSNNIARCRADLDRWDNDTRWNLRPYLTDDNPGAAMLFFGGTLLRIKTHGSLTITGEEAGYTGADEFWVETIDGPTGRWLDYEWTDNPRAWVGKYEGYPGQAPRLLAKSWTTNRIKHKDAIAEARRELHEHEAALEEKDAMWAARWAQQAAEGRADVDGDGGAAARTDADRRMDELVGWIETAKNLDKVLGQRNPPIDTSFNEAARRRYRKMPSQITAEDLYEFVQAAGLEAELMKPLKEAVRL